MSEKRQFTPKELQKYIADHFPDEARAAIKEAGYERFAKTETDKDTQHGVGFVIWDTETIEGLHELEELTAKLLRTAILAGYSSSGAGSY